jgi:hypothetical protein
MASELEGTDCVWFAVDEDEHVAAFTTAGVAPVPRRVLENLALFYELTAVVAALPATGASVIAPDVTYNERGLTDYRGWAARGLYGYDWVDVHRTRNCSNRYELIAAPTAPLDASALAAQLGRMPRLRGVRFATATRVDVSDE